MNQKSQFSASTSIMNIKDVAKYLGVHTITIYRMIKETDIPTFKLRGQWRFKRDILDAWIDRQMQKKRQIFPRA